jgi:hypothetical protein
MGQVLGYGLRFDFRLYISIIARRFCRCILYVHYRYIVVWQGVCQTSE